MSIRIKPEQCIGCGQCGQVCPGSLIQIREKKAWMIYPKDCWGCASCVKECPVQAIDFYLGADMGGRGTTMNVKKNGDVLYWQIQSKEGKVQTIAVNTKNSNQY